MPEENISFERDTYTFNFPGSPSEFLAVFRTYYGPTMNAYEAAAADGREAELQAELEELFNSQNASASGDATSIPATFLRVTVRCEVIADEVSVAGEGDHEAAWPGAIAAITLFVEDLEASRRFYQAVFGLPVTYEDDNSAVFTFGQTMINLLKTMRRPD